VYKYRKAILYLVERHATTIVVGETGSGKSTQIPQVRASGLLFFLQRPLCPYRMLSRARHLAEQLLCVPVNCLTIRVSVIVFGDFLSV
jgi:predicted ATP-binding protein involved in virulence